jgi:membrane fusion protein (multidrug efflux system)
VASFATALILAGCDQRQDIAPSGASLPTVLVVTVEASPVPNIVELPGRIEPV